MELSFSMDNNERQETLLLMDEDSKLEKAWIAASLNGWADNELSEAWVTKCVDPETRDKYVIGFKRGLHRLPLDRSGMSMSCIFWGEEDKCIFYLSSNE